MRITTVLLLCMVFPVSCTLIAPPEIAGKALTLERIFIEQPSLSGRTTNVVRWLPDVPKFLVEERVQSGEDERRRRTWFQIDAQTGEKTIYLDADRIESTIGKSIDSDRRPNNRGYVSTLSYTPDLEWIVYRKDGDLYVQGLHSGDPRKITETPGDEQFPRISPDGSFVAFVRNDNVHVVKVSDGTEKTITRDGTGDVRYGTTDWVHDEELGMMRGLFWSPDNRHLAYYRFDTTLVPRIPMVDYMPHHKSLKMLEYPKPGDPVAKVELFLADIETGESKPIDLGPPEERYLPRVGFTPTGDILWVQVLSRDMSHLSLCFTDLESGRTRVALEERSKSWISPSRVVDFLDDGRFLWSSSRSGYSHIYICQCNGKIINAVTSGDFDASSVVHVDQDGGKLYYSASGPHAAERHLFRVNLDGTESTRITTAPGGHSISMSNCGNYYIDTFSTLMRPSQKAVYRTDNGQIIFSLGRNDVPELEEYRLGTPELFQVTTRDGVKLNAMLLKPADFDPTKRYPVICSTYGGPGSQTIRDRWGGSGWLWYHMLTQKGYLVFWVDHRGSGDHGQAGASLMHRKLCTIEWQDQVEAIEYLRKQPYVAPDRVGIWGWSYGGTAAVTCLLKAPDHFQAAVAVAPVLDFANYDAIYTERYMDTPAENPEGYEGTKLSNYVDNLKGNLLLIHGLQDDNVLAQNTFQLAWALQNANKPFEMMIYPKGSHGIGNSRIRLHLYEMITRFFLENL